MSGISVTITNQQELEAAKRRLAASKNADEKHVLKTAIEFYEGGTNTHFQVG